MSVGYPVAIEREYRRRLLRRVEEVTRRVARELEAIVREVERRRQADARADADEDLAERARQMLIRLRGMVGREPPPSGPLEATAGDVDRFATGRVQSLVASAAEKARDPAAQAIARVPLFRTPEARQRAEAWARENVSLITSIDARYFDDLERLFVGAIERGTNGDALRKILQERYGVSRSRAELIARDQIAKLNGQIAEARQRELGITEYRWSTVGDERVRESHAAKDGRIFRWSDPPADTGHPGQDFSCRCTAEPVLPRTGPGSRVAEILSRTA